MNKLKSHLCSAFCALALLIPQLSHSAYAEGFNFSISGNDSFTDTLYVSLYLSNSASAGGSCNGVCGITTIINYDQSKLSLISSTAAQGFDYTSGDVNVLYRATGAPDGPVLTLQFRNKSLGDGESTTIFFNNIIATNGDRDFSYGSVSRSFTYAAPAPAPTPAPDPTPSQSNASSTAQTSQPTQQESTSEPKVQENNDSEKTQSAESTKDSAQTQETSEKATEENQSQATNETGDNTFNIVLVSILLTILAIAAIEAIVYVIVKHKKRTDDNPPDIKTY